MLEFLKIWLELKVDRRAVTALEYGLIAGAVVASAAAAFTTFGGNLSTAFNNMATKL
jgi:Flp pilus assembly pilin Flp